MEAIHKPNKRTWIDKNVTNVKDFFDSWNSALSLVQNTSLESSVSKEEYDKIKEACGPAALRCRYQELVEPASSITIPEGVHLKILEFQAKDLERRASDPQYYNALYHSSKGCNYPPQQVFNTVEDTSCCSQDSIVTSDVVLSVQFYNPERAQKARNSVGYCRMAGFSLDQEVLVLGCQYLSELRDKIECVSDKAISGEFSECPSYIEGALPCKEIYKSGFFFINGTFYNDMRDPDCRDYSEIILNWTKERNRGIGPFKKAIMEETQFMDLSIQLGYPYVYIHQGDCEHLMVFSDLRMFSSNHDVNNRNAYPLYVQVKPSKRVFCMICHAYTASWIVYDNKRLPENPYLFCKTCFVNFNYDKNDEKIGSFRAYHFPDFAKHC